MSLRGLRDAQGRNGRAAERVSRGSWEMKSREMVFVSACLGVLGMGTAAVDVVVDPCSTGDGLFGRNCGGLWPILAHHVEVYVACILGLRGHVVMG